MNLKFSAVSKAEIKMEDEMKRKKTLKMELESIVSKFDRLTGNKFR